MEVYHSGSDVDRLKGRSERMVKWIKTHYVQRQDSLLPKREVYEDYLKVCRYIGFECTTAPAFGKLVRSAFPGIGSRRLGQRGSSQHYYQNLARVNPDISILDLDHSMLTLNASREEFSGKPMGVPRHGRSDISQGGGAEGTIEDANSQVIEAAQLEYSTEMRSFGEMVGSLHAGDTCGVAATELMGALERHYTLCVGAARLDRLDDVLKDIDALMVRVRKIGVNIANVKLVSKAVAVHSKLLKAVLYTLLPCCFQKASRQKHTMITRFLASLFRQVEKLGEREMECKLATQILHNMMGFAISCRNRHTLNMLHLSVHQYILLPSGVNTSMLQNAAHMILAIDWNILEVLSLRLGLECQRICRRLLQGLSTFLRVDFASCRLEAEMSNLCVALVLDAKPKDNVFFILHLSYCVQTMFSNVMIQWGSSDMQNVVAFLRLLLTWICAYIEYIVLDDQKALQQRHGIEPTKRPEELIDVKRHSMNRLVNNIGSLGSFRLPSLDADFSSLASDWNTANSEQRAPKPSYELNPDWEASLPKD